MDRMPCFELGDVGSIPAGPARQGDYTMKPITFKNKINNEQVICEDVKLVQLIDGIEYLQVHRPGQTRVFLMRKDALERVAKNPQPH